MRFIPFSVLSVVYAVFLQHISCRLFVPALSLKLAWDWRVL